jgi:hypothetical protein
MHPPSFLRHLQALTLSEVQNIQGFMQLLMKPRNGLPWTPADKQALVLHLRHMGRTLPFLALFTLPGGSLLLPLLAWFLDRRKRRQREMKINQSSDLTATEASDPIRQPLSHEKE